MNNETDNAFRNSFEHSTDEELVELAKNGNKVAENSLMVRYTKLVNQKANKYFSIGLDHDDIKQEGMIGLYKAIKSFDSEKENSFKTFANLCVERQLITTIKSANRQKNVFFNSAISINQEIEDESSDANEVMQFMETAESRKLDPSHIVENTEFYKEVFYKMNNALTDKEKRVLQEMIKGSSYAEIAKKLNCTVKSVDSAITRVRKKGNHIWEHCNDC